MLVMGTRKTVDLDDDANSYLRDEMRRTGKPLSTTFNEVIREGVECRDRLRQLDTMQAKVSHQPTDLQTIK